MAVNELGPARAWAVVLPVCLLLHGAAEAATTTKSTKAASSAAASTTVKLKAGIAAESLVSPASTHPAASTQPMVPGPAAPKATIRTPKAGSVRGLRDRAQMPAEANAVRDMRGVQELGATLRGVDTSNNDLLKPGGVDLAGQRSAGSRFGNVPANRGDRSDARMPEGMPRMPDLPRNSNKRPGSLVGSPSHNLRAHMSGAAGQDGEHGRVVGYESDGGVVPETGTVYSRETRLYEDGYMETEVFSQHADGGSTVQTIRTDLERNTITMDVVHRDREGNVTGKDRIVTEADPRSGEGIAGTQDPNAVRGDGSVCRAMPWVCRGAPGPVTTHVNPGRGTGGFVPARQIDPGEAIVVNPSTEQARQANQARAINPDGLRDAVGSGTHVNPPGPND